MAIYENQLFGGSYGLISKTASDATNYTTSSSAETNTIGSEGADQALRKAAPVMSL
jgi:hypothetical protein